MNKRTFIEEYVLARAHACKKFDYDEGVNFAREAIEAFNVIERVAPEETEVLLG